MPALQATAQARMPLSRRSPLVTGLERGWDESGCSRAGVRGAGRSFQRFEEGHKLPALLLGQATPGGHTFVGRAGGDEPKELAIRRGLRGTLGESGEGPYTLAVWPVATGAVGSVQLCAGLNGGVLPGHGVLLLGRGGRCVVKVSFLSIEARARKQEQVE